MAQGRDRKILRIGIIQNGKIIEERLLRKRETVTIGQSPRNTFVLPSGGIPKTYALFELKGGVYQLNFKSAMKGKVSVNDAVLDFAGLRQRGIAQTKGDVHSLALSDKSRGKVVVGDVTLLFQFVTPPPPPSRLQLPASVRGGWMKGMDWPFVACFFGSLVFQVLALVIIVTGDYPEKPKTLESLPDRFVEVMTKPSTPPPPKPVDTTDGKEDEKKVEDKVAEVKPKPKPKPKVAPTPVEKKPPKSAEEVARAKAKTLRKMQEKVSNRTILKHIGSKGGDGPGNILDTLAGGATDVRMADAFDGTDGVMIAAAADVRRDRRRGRGKSTTGKVAGIKDSDLRAKGGGVVKSGKKTREVKVKGSVKVKAPSEAFGTGVLDSRAIAKVVSRRKGAVKSCYEKQLKRNPKLSGKVKVQFTILESGRVGSTKVVQDTMGDKAVGNCIKTKIKRWRFPKPDGGSVTVAFPFVFAPSS